MPVYCPGKMYGVVETQVQTVPISNPLFTLAQVIERDIRESSDVLWREGYSAQRDAHA
jgi:hypothetical protein